MLSIKDFESVEANNISKSLRRPVYGVGINDAPFRTNIKHEGRTNVHPAMKCWIHILERCYCEATRSKYPTYGDVVVSDDWLSFMGFYAWWKDNYKPDHFIDKDLLTDSKVYSSETCIFVPRWLNNLVLNPKNRRDGMPIGANWHKRHGAYQSRVHDFSIGKRINIGYFDTAKEANEAYVMHKLDVAYRLKTEMDSIDIRIYPRVVEIINRMK